jgi:CRP/FNR family transcriptional regulator, cyclic AMP receptor protein
LREEGRVKTSDPASSDPLQFLCSLPLFSGLSEAAQLALKRAIYQKRVSKSAYIFFQSDAAEAAYIVWKGAVAIELASADGRQLVINEMRPGDCFGELSLLTQQPRSTAAVAQLDSQLIVIPRQAFLALLDSEPRLARRLLETTARRLSSSSERESALAFLDAQARLARVLLELDRQADLKGYITISQAELAQHTGLIRQTVAKILGRWRRSGWLVTGRGRIMLLNRDKLGQLDRQVNEWT